MYLGKALDSLLSRFPSGTDRIVARNYFNLATQEVYRAANWEFRKRTGQIVLVPNYTTGTCTITQYDGTNDSAARTVTFSTALSQNMVGRYFQPSGSSQWYKIVYISGSTAVLDTPVIDVSASGSAFTIWKRFYYLKSEVDTFTDFGSWETGNILNYISSTGLSDSTSALHMTGTGQSFTPYGIDPFDDKTYTDGTISGSENSNVITGSGTAFLANADSGDSLTVGEVEYTIKRVESDTRLILQNYLVADIAGGSSFSIRKNNPIGVQIFPNTEQYRIVHYEYWARTCPMVNELKDIFPMPDEFLTVTYDRAESMILKDKDNPRWSSVLALYQAELEGLKLKKNAAEPRFNQFAPKIPNFMPGRG